MTTNQDDFSDSTSDAGSTTTWGLDWPHVGISRANLFDSVVKPGYESHSYLEVGVVIHNLMDWKDTTLAELDSKIANGSDPSIVPDPSLVRSLKRLKNKIILFTNQHLDTLRSRVQQLRSEDQSI